jgi:hypothetical protein
LHVPQHFAAVRIECDHAPVGRAAKDLAVRIAETSSAGADRHVVEVEHMAPAQRAGCGVQADGETIGGDVKRSARHHQPTAEDDRLVELDLAHLLEATDVLRRDLVQIDVALAGIVLVHRHPLVGGRRRARRAANPGQERHREETRSKPGADRTSDPRGKEIRLWFHGGAPTMVDANWPR